MDSHASSPSVRPTLPPLHTLDLPRGDTQLPRIDELYESRGFKRQVNLDLYHVHRLADSGAISRFQDCTYPVANAHMHARTVRFLFRHRHLLALLPPPRHPFHPVVLVLPDANLLKYALCLPLSSTPTLSSSFFHQIPHTCIPSPVSQTSNPRSPCS
jgi:hypothetical protein